MDLDAMRAAVRRRAGVSSSDQLAADADLLEIINGVMNEISGEAAWPWLEDTRTFVTVAGTQGYATATRWAQTGSLKIDGYGPLGFYSRKQLEEWFPLAATRGTPEYYTVSGDELLLFPTPDGVYTVTEVFTAYEAQLAAGSDTPAMPLQFHTAIVHGAAEELLLRMREDERAAREAQRKAAILGRMRKAALRSGALMRVRVRPGSAV